MPTVKNRKGFPVHIPDIAVIMEHCWFYSFWNGTFTEVEGFVYRSGTDFKFYANDRWYICYSKPAVVFNNGVWLLDKDYDKALSLLIEKEASSMHILNEKIAKHCSNIVFLGNLRRTEECQENTIKPVQIVEPI